MAFSNDLWKLVVAGVIGGVLVHGAANVSFSPLIYAQVERKPSNEGLVHRVEMLERQFLKSPPIGTVVAFAGDWPPKKLNGDQWTEGELGWMLCDGRKWDHPSLKGTIAQLSELLKVIGGDNLPDYRGGFLRGIDVSIDNGRTGHDEDGVRKVNSLQNWSTGMPVKTFDTTLNEGFDPASGDGTHLVQNSGIDTVKEKTDNTLNEINIRTGVRIRRIPAVHVTGGDKETRPTNMAVYWIIRFK